jgi:hypothetical protein
MAKGFVEYKYGAFKKQIRELLRKRASLKNKIAHHKRQIDYHKDNIVEIEKKTIPEVEKELNKYLKLAGN